MARINARLDDEYMAKLERLKSQMHTSTTEVLKLAIDDLYETQLNQKQAKLQALLNSDFVGCGEAEADLSSHYKSYLNSDLSKKHDNR
ncbi:CopG family transcriptional regulator [Saccharobesus litoralis]|uniref:CopG family transcriptional regulator n=1 Tax=Saccharobesus litoralis TaxID=2172099 RepID=A0A2S0VSV1_9ALTE|nr:ribbon-helix-helix domain-containing protein [Saccharobesus litoralis]AWB67291.1 CopG family transcriptional regulator [Saccharobesus litoralis]